MRNELTELFKHLSGTSLWMARVIYGCGLRLMECARLRIKDLDFEMNALTVRGGKGMDLAMGFPCPHFATVLQRIFSKTGMTFARSRIFLDTPTFRPPGFIPT